MGNEGYRPGLGFRGGALPQAILVYQLPFFTLSTTSQLPAFANSMAVKYITKKSARGKAVVI